MENVIKLKECQEVVKKLLNKSEVKVFDFQIIELTGDYPGFCADYCRLKISYEDNDGLQTSKQFFAKALPITNLKKREFIRAFGVFKKEADLARQLLPEILKYSDPFKWCPSFYYVQDDFMIMEDLTANGFQMMDIKFKYSPSHIFEALKTIAVFHAAGICYDQKELKPNNTNMSEKFKSMLFQTQFVDDNKWTRAGFKAVKAVALQRTKYGIGTKYEEKIKNSLILGMNETFGMCKNPKTNVPHTWIHQDLWNNNLMYICEDGVNNPKHCVILDFGICCYFPLSLDVLMLIYCCTTSTGRKEMYESYLKFYYETIQSELSKNGLDKLFSLEDFVDNCKDFSLFALVLRCLYLASTFLPSELLQTLSENDEEAYKKLMMEDRDNEVLEAMDNDADYRGLLTEATEELIEYLFVRQE